MNPNEMTNSEIEAWFGACGLDATVVQRCPALDCRLCQRPELPAAA